jgi:hypothetical protein
VQNCVAKSLGMGLAWLRSCWGQAALALLQYGKASHTPSVTLKKARPPPVESSERKKERKTLRNTLRKTLRGQSSMRTTEVESSESDFCLSGAEGGVRRGDARHSARLPVVGQRQDRSPHPPRTPHTRTRAVVTGWIRLAPARAAQKRVIRVVAQAAHGVQLTAGQGRTSRSNHCHMMTVTRGTTAHSPLQFSYCVSSTLSCSGRMLLLERGFATAHEPY